MKAYLHRFFVYMVFAGLLTFVCFVFEIFIPKMMSLFGPIDLSVISGLTIYIAIAVVICAVSALFKL